MHTRLHEIVADAAARRADAPAVTYGGDTLDYAGLWQGVTRVAAGLRRLGLRRGDRVAVYTEKRIEAVEAIFGISAADGVFVPVNPLLRARQVGYILADCTVRVLITTPERFALLRDELEQIKSVETVVLVGGSTDGAAVSWADLTAGTPEPPAPGGLDIDVAAILYTSGSTGRPKGVVLSHRNLLVGGASVSRYLDNRPDDVILAALPLSFDAGFSQLTTAFTVGAHVVLMNYVLARDVVRLCAQHRVTGLTCVAPLWLQLAGQKWTEEATRHLRYFANTGGRMPKATLEQLRGHFPQAEPFLMYGLTEAFRSTYLDPAEVDRRPDSIGKAIPNAEILVLRPDGTPTDPGEEGELVHRGALVALGYWNDPQRTAERFRPLPGRAGELVPEIAVFSGDTVVRDEEGFLYFVGRADEMIKTSGYRVSPTEIEEVAYDSGLVGDAVVVGLPDDALGQRIVLVASPPAGGALDSAALTAMFKRELPLFMVPRTIVERPALPRSPNGKFDRTLIRQELNQ
ncbi:acyl-CoA ligase (AMP-forming), exosortase A system-associated [Actinoplanes sp. NPDC024001]|uniref:acyl-CoA ligase (AMP-forming), exosortase A system-associated n=1 Tax=Actinoplanes sp. NPDC024001 TaxID=3154598 RepID=UPI0033FE05F4